MKRLNSEYTKKIVALCAIFAIAALFPSITDAMRRNHAYHSSTKVTTTPSVSPIVSPVANKQIEGDELLTGKWDYLQSATRSGNTLVITPTDMTIVSQDGTKSISNPPINLAGTYLSDISGEFSITAGMQVPSGTTATMQLYGNPPLIADEFRIEQPSLQLNVTDGQLQARVWTGKSQTPAITQTFSLPMDGTLFLTINRQADSMQFMVNNTVIGTVKTVGLLTSGKLWFGFDSAKGDWALTSLKAQTVNTGKFTVVDGSDVRITTHNAQGLQALATKKRPGFLVGMAMALGPAVADSTYAGIAFDNAMFGSMTPENDMKMINLQPQKGVYTFKKADALVKLAKQNGVSDIHGHTLVFGEANPLWVNKLPVKTAADKKEVEKVMVDHITTVVKHFGNSVSSWDVINEPIADYDEFESDGKTFRNHIWYKAMGSSYIIKALTAAYNANPTAILSINEYGLEEDGERWDAFIGVMKQLKLDLQAQKIPVSNISVGFQAHVYESGDKINPSILKEHIEALAELGFKSQISENDVYSDDGVSIQAQQYAVILSACIDEPSCIAWRGWILSDKYDTFEDDGKIEYGEDGLFGKTMKPRPGFTAMQQVLNDTAK